jgi:molybdate transport system substrate-binding protein
MFPLITMLGTLIAISLSANATELRVYSGGAPQMALKVLAPQFERASGHRVSFTYGVVGDIRKRLGAGEKADVIMLPVPLMDSIEKAGGLHPESRTLLARVGIGVIVREGAARPSISGPDDVRKTLLEARSIAYPDPKLTPSGKHLAGVVGKLGIADALSSKTTLKNAIDGGVALVANGNVEIGMFLVSEITPVKGVTLVGLLPPALQSYVVYAGAIGADSSAAEAALAFLKFLSDPANQAHWKAAGFEPLGTTK